MTTTIPPQEAPALLDATAHLLAGGHTLPDAVAAAGGTPAAVAVTVLRGHGTLTEALTTSGHLTDSATSLVDLVQDQPRLPAGLHAVAEALRTRTQVASARRSRRRLTAAAAAAGVLTAATVAALAAGSLAAAAAAIAATVAAAAVGWRFGDRGGVLESQAAGYVWGLVAAHLSSCGIPTGEAHAQAWSATTTLWPGQPPGNGDDGRTEVLPGTPGAVPTGCAGLPQVAGAAAASGNPGAVWGTWLAATRRALPVAVTGFATTTSLAVLACYTAAVAAGSVAAAAAAVLAG